MFEIDYGGHGRIVMVGRLDAEQAPRAQLFLDAAENPGELDCGGLEYVSSAGLRVLLRTQKRVMSQGGGLKLVNVGRHVGDVLRYSGFDKIFEVVPAPDPSG